VDAKGLEAADAEWLEPVDAEGLNERQVLGVDFEKLGLTDVDEFHF
jgi:hypothetical protein